MKYSHAGSSSSWPVRCRVAVTATKARQVVSSISGYRMLIRKPQPEHHPRSASQPNTGTLCRLRTWVWQFGQCEPGQSSDWPAGTRWMTTVRNEADHQAQHGDRGEQKVHRSCLPRRCASEPRTSGGLLVISGRRRDADDVPGVVRQTPVRRRDVRAPAGHR